MHSLFKNSSTSWTRYTNYEWRLGPDGHVYLMPTPDSTTVIYDPMDVAQQMVIDAVYTGIQCSNLFSNTEEQHMDLIRQFACKYGLLGMMVGLPTTAHFVEYEKVYLPRNQFIREETMVTEEYISLFFPFKQPRFAKTGKEDFLWQMNTTEHEFDEISLMMTFQNESTAKAMSFTRDYGERYDWMIEVFLEWSFILRACFDAYVCNRDSPRAYRVIHEAMRAFDRNLPTYHIELRETPIVVWNLHSLMLTIQLLMTGSLTDEAHPLHMCAVCGKPFPADSRDQYFCSEECRQRYVDVYGTDELPPPGWDS